MKLIVGLGNPGRRYVHTRHNIGFRTIETLAKRHKIEIKRRLFGRSREARFNISNRDLMLIEPLTFMNLSGDCVLRYINRFKIALDNIFVVCDDINLSLGKIRIRPQGTAGGHNGLESVIRSLRTTVFPRLRIGIKREEFVGDLAEYVLSDFEEEETMQAEDALLRAAAACECWATDGIDETMNRYNG